MISTLLLYTPPRVPRPPTPIPKPKVKKAPDCGACQGFREHGVGHCPNCGKNLVTGAAPRFGEQRRRGP